MILAHSLGFPRIGRQRQMKFAVESFWQGELDEAQLLEVGKKIRQENWRLQAEVGLKLLPVGDFSWYDQVLDLSLILGVVPKRFLAGQEDSNLLTYFQMARGHAPGRESIRPCEMTKWFDTNYHYIVPELEFHQDFSLSSFKLFAEIKEAQALGYEVKPTLIGPLSFLWLSKFATEPFDKLKLLSKLLQVYEDIINELLALKIDWLQIEEPILVLDLPLVWRQALQVAYRRLGRTSLRLLLTTYFGPLDENLELAAKLPVAGLHLEGISHLTEAFTAANLLDSQQILSLGIINGRNVWRANLAKILEELHPLQEKRPESLWLSASSSFLHCPVDLEEEFHLDEEIRPWLAFSKQKTRELVVLAQALNEGVASVEADLSANRVALNTKTNSLRIHNSVVKQRSEDLSEQAYRRSPYVQRRELQKQLLKLPLFPTTTIGSFPQTAEIRKFRHEFKQGSLSSFAYEDKIKQIIGEVIHQQSELGLDVLVHGEAERSDMVEYFAENLTGFLFTEHGWVQSYGSRCVKPPIIYGDVSRLGPITTTWSQYAQSLTNKPVKGMLTGPVTLVSWSFVREDQSRYKTMEQVALALRDEVKDLETAGIKIIQIDEPAFREGLPLRPKHWQIYLQEAVRCFKLASGSAKDQTQIHTHMCYSEFNDIIDAIADLDADVISLEASRSNMELLEAFKSFAYPNAIGPGVYDIHSPRIPSVEEMMYLSEKALSLIPKEQLWLNPDCGLKTRTWEEVKAALSNMVKVAQRLRLRYAQNSGARST